MAQNYMQFSEVIDELTVEEHEWLKNALALNEDGGYDDGVEPPAWWDDGSETFGFEYDLTPEEFHLYSDEYGNIDTVQALVSEFISLFRKDYVFTLSWSESCSKPRIGEFGGGGMVVTLDETRFMNVWGWLESEKKRIAESRLSKSL
jgi:hypothetical protein